MAENTRFIIAKPDIIKAFKETDKKVFNRFYLSKVLKSNRQNWRLTESLTVNEFIKLLLKNTPPEH